MADLAVALSYEFFRNAVMAGVLASLLCGVIGAFVLVKRLVFVSGGISHAAFGGIGLGHWLGFPPQLGALGAATVCAWVLGRLGSERFRAHDALIGVLWSTGMALGIVFMHLAPGYSPDLMSYLFGDILSVTNRDLALALLVDALVLGSIALFYKELVAVAFDESFAAVQGVPVRAVFTALMVLIALSIVLLIQVVGIVLVIALLSIPPLLARQVTKSFQGLLVGSVTAGLVMTQLGLLLSYRYDLPAGPSIIILGALLLCATLFGQSLARRRRREERS